MKSFAAFAVAIGSASASMQAYGAPPPSYESATTSSAPAASATPACPAPGTTGPDGRYSCNPAHAYPDGQICDMSDGCYYLRVPGPGVSASATESMPSYSTPACPAPGSTGPNGQYSCNPAHAYPDGQICDMSEGCYYLRSPGPGVSTSYTPPMTSTTIVCPGPTTLTHGGMTYPVTEATTLTVPYAPTTPPAPPAYTPPAAPPAAYSPPAPVSPAAPACPAAGSTNSAGQYSCNPAHAYPAGQTCVMQNGCPYLVYASTTAPVSPPPTGYVPQTPASPVTPSNGTTPPITPYTGSAAKVAAAGVPVAVLAMGVLFL